MKEIEISEVRFTTCKNSKGLTCFCSVLLDEWLRISNIAIYETKGNNKFKYRLVFPSKKVKGKERFFVYPINKTLAENLTQQIIEHYEQQEF